MFFMCPAVSHSSGVHCKYSFLTTVSLFMVSQLVLWCFIRKSFAINVQMWVLDSQRFFQRQSCFFGFSLVASPLRHLCVYIDIIPYLPHDPQWRSGKRCAYSLRRWAVVLQVRKLGSLYNRAHQACSVICTVNLVLTIMLVRAPEGVRNIAAQCAPL